MKKLLILALLFWGCDYAPTEHTHSDCAGEIGKHIELWGNCLHIEGTTSLTLAGGELAGVIPSKIGNLTNLTRLDLGGNQLTGEIPPEIGNLTNLTWLNLRSNQLTGEIPPEVCDLIESNSLSPEWNIEDRILYGNNLINTCD